MQIDAIQFNIEIYEKYIQSVKQYSLIDVTLFGIKIYIRFVQS